MTNDRDERVRRFCQQFGLRVPVLLAPMAGACPPGLSVAVMEAGGMGACGALLMRPAEIVQWAGEVRNRNGGPFQVNLWVPDPAPRRDPEHEARVRRFLEAWGPPRILLVPNDFHPSHLEAPTARDRTDHC